MPSEIEKDTSFEHRHRMVKAMKSVSADKMNPHQLIEFLLLLLHAVAPKNANETASRLLSAFPTVVDIFRAPVSELREKGDISVEAAVFLRIAYDIYSKYGGHITDGKIYITNPVVVDVYLKRVFSSRPKTELAVFLTDREGAVISVKDAGFTLSGDILNTAKKLLELKESYPEGIRLYAAKKCDTVSKSDCLRAEYLMNLLNQKGDLKGDFFFLTENGVVLLSDILAKSDTKDILKQ